jgi:hypothetical protein
VIAFADPTNCRFDQDEPTTSCDCSDADREPTRVVIVIDDPNSLLADGAEEEYLCLNFHCEVPQEVCTRPRERPQWRARSPPNMAPPKAVAG